MNIVIDEQWLEANREEWGGWRLGKAGATYTLATDVYSPTTAFAMGADNITLDMQGHTISFNNEAEIPIANYQFGLKRGKPQGWTLPSGAYIEKPCYYDDVKSQVYNSAAVVPEVRAGEEHCIENNRSYRLKAGRTYCLAFWDMRKPAGSKLPKCQVRVEIAGLAPVMGPKKDKDGTSSYAVFQPKEDLEGKIKVFVTLEDQTETEAGQYRIDNMMLSHYRGHGITGRGSNDSWNNPCPELPLTAEYRRGLYGFTLKSSAGSKIVEGRPSIGGNCINLKSSKNTKICGTVYMSIHERSVADGQGGKCMFGQYAQDLTIEPTVRTNNRNFAITSRQGHYGYNLHATTMKGDNNIGLNAIDSPQGGMSIGQHRDSGGSLRITGNLKATTRFTNGFSLMVHEGGALSSTVVENVTINNTGDHGGRGIHWVGSPYASGLNVLRNCYIHTKEIPMNQEYGYGKDGYPLGGCYGIQVESSCKNLIIDNNFVSVSGLSESAAYRLSGPKDYSKPLTCTTTSNTFQALCDDPSRLKGRAAVFKPYMIDGDTLGRHKGNRLVFNDCLILFNKGNKGTILFEDTTIEYIEDGSLTESAYEVGYRGAGTVEFRNTTFIGTSTFNKLTKATDLAPNLIHAGGDIIVKFTDSAGKPFYTLSGNHITEVTHHIWDLDVN